MNEYQLKKFQAWLEPYVIDGTSEFVITSEGTFYFGTDEHVAWVEAKRKEFKRKEPPLAGVVYKHLSMEELRNFVSNIFKKKK